MRYELAVEIARPPAEVWAYLADPTHLPQWQADVEEVRDAPGGPLGLGATFTEVRSFLGKRAESTLEVAGTSHRLPSGPLHDAAEVSRGGVPTVMLFVQSLRGLSHTKLEDTKPEHLELSVATLDALASKTLDWLAHP